MPDTPLDRSGPDVHPGGPDRIRDSHDGRDERPGVFDGSRRFAEDPALMERARRMREAPPPADRAPRTDAPATPDKERR